MTDHYERKVKEHDPSTWAKDRCRHGQGAGSVFGCIKDVSHNRLPLGDPGRLHVYDDPKWETVAEVNEWTMHQGACYHCETTVGEATMSRHVAARALEAHMREHHPELITG